MRTFRIHEGDALAVLRGLPGESVQTCVTSPPYWGLRDYKVEGQLGLEATPELYVGRLVSIFREAKRVLRGNGTLWLNLADSYASIAGGYDTTGSRGTSAKISARTQAAVVSHKRRQPPAGYKPKDLIGIPWMLAFALRSDGWCLRSDIIWHKPNAMPESVQDRPTKAHEYIFLLSKSARYFYDTDSIKEPLAVSTLCDARRGAETKRDYGLGANRFGEGTSASRRAAGSHFDSGIEARNKRSVWSVNTASFSEAHFATFPPELITPCILAGSKEGDTVLDPFAGSGTTGLVALRHNRNFIGVELNPDYVQMARRRIQADAPLFNKEDAA